MKKILYIAEILH